MLIFSFLFTGKKPIKINSFVFIPELINALIAAQAPGIGIISIFSLIASLTIFSPGSEIPGVPASETSAIFSPFNIFSIKTLLLFFSICL